jgi:hypothetical protein
LESPQLAAARRVLDELDRLDAREAVLFAAARKYPRHSYRGTVTIRIDEPALGIYAFEATCFGQSLSVGGLSFIYPAALPVRRLSVTIEMPDGSQRSFEGTVVRTRSFPDDGFWEFGVEFLRRLDPNAAAPA